MERSVVVARTPLPSSPARGEVGRGGLSAEPPPGSITDLSFAKSYLASLPTRGREGGSASMGKSFSSGARHD